MGSWGVIRNSLCEEVTFEQKLNGVRVCACGYLEDGVFQEVGTCAQVLKHILGAVWRQCA